MSELTTTQPDFPVSAARMRQAMESYIAAFNACDAAAIAELYADDAVVEDPVGNPTPVVGRPAILAFYQQAVTMGVRLKLVAPVRGSHGNAAAMAFEAEMGEASGSPGVIRIIDVMTFDSRGKFSSMKAYWAPDDIIPA